MAITEILVASTSSARSASFKSKRFISINGTKGAATFDIKYKDSHGNYQTTGAVIDRLGVHNVPVSDQLEMVVDYTAGGGSNIAIEVMDGPINQ